MTPPLPACRAIVDLLTRERPPVPDETPTERAIREAQGEREAKRRRRAQRAQGRGWDVFRALADAARKDWAEMQDAPEHNE